MGRFKKQQLYWAIMFSTIILVFIVQSAWYVYYSQFHNISKEADLLFRVLIILSGAVLLAMFFFYNINRIDSRVKKEQERFESIVAAVKDGILIMNDDRSIEFMNEAAEDMTGWKVGEKVPYCSYCQDRDVLPGEERCLLANPEALAYFEADMPVYRGKKQRTFEMSTAFIDQVEENKRQMILVMRDNELKRNEERAKLAQILIHETLAAQEAERKRLAQELHDGIGQSLYSINIGLKAIESGIKKDDTTGRHFSVLEKTLQDVVKEVKTLSYELRPATLDMLGLVPSLQTLIQFLRDQTGKEIVLITEVDEEKRYPAHMELHLYRIVQEALHNAAKYAEATQITVRIREYDRTLELKIMDNGKGFDLEENKKGLGLKHMRERAELLEGELQIHSSALEGTQVICRVPLKEDLDYGTV
ncbi:MAG: PAS domain-containing protein [Bacillaceae bacterium]|nr:PAS domain-containing protein [Bacillaceae bacterium]